MMKYYNLLILPEAQEDLREYIRYIREVYHSPNDALKHYEKIMEKMDLLKIMAESISVDKSRSLMKFGINVRRVNYKKMTIIYTVHGQTIYIRRIIAASMITGL